MALRLSRCRSAIGTMNDRLRQPVLEVPGVALPARVRHHIARVIGIALRDTRPLGYLQ